MQRKICEKCKMFLKSNECPQQDPNCPVIKHNKFSTTWKGRFIIVDAEKSLIAQKLKIKIPGEYAIKTK